MRRTLSVCLSVRPSSARMYFVYICTVLRAHIQNRKTSVFAYGPASRMYFSARAEGRIPYGHLRRTNSCLIFISLCSSFRRFSSQRCHHGKSDFTLYSFGIPRDFLVHGNPATAIETVIYSVSTFYNLCNCNSVASGVGTGGSGGSMNRGPRAPGAPRVVGP